jgi:hypothetical protein
MELYKIYHNHTKNRVNDKYYICYTHERLVSYSPYDTSKGGMCMMVRFDEGEIISSIGWVSEFSEDWGWKILKESSLPIIVKIEFIKLVFK